MTAAVKVDVIQNVLNAAVFVLLRVGSGVVTMPVMNSAGIPQRVKAMFVLALTAVLTPVASAISPEPLTLSAPALLGEIGVGLSFGLSLALLNEALLFAASLMSAAFSFSLANMLDPNSMVETEVLGTVISWMGVLVLLAAGLHRTMLAALMRTLVEIPPGHASDAIHSGSALVEMAAGIFLAGVQLAAPVVAAALLTEVAIGLVGRLAPALPAQIASVPVKTLISYAVLIAALAVWPSWIEHRFVSLLDAARKNVN